MNSRIGRVRATLVVNSEEVEMTSDRFDDTPPAPVRRPRLTIEELARRKGVRPIESLDDMACDIFASDEELDEFLAYTYANRRAGLA